MRVGGKKISWYSRPAFRDGKTGKWIASENILLSLLIKAGVIFLGFVGHANLWLAIIAETAVAVICIFNAIRLLYFGKYRLR